MAELRCDFASEVLEVDTSMTVVLPDRVEGQRATGPEGLPVLYLLHGLGVDDTSWLRRTSIERYAEPLGLAVVMPSVVRSCYTDEAHGLRYWTFLTEELPLVVDRFFHVSTRREDTFVAGLSMGGYGALKWALRHPDRFAAAASLSGALDLAVLLQEPDRAELLSRVFGAAVGPDDDLLRLLDVADPRNLPPLFVGCGTEDHLVAANRTFEAAAGAAGVALDVEYTSGGHEWDYWDAAIRRVLAWLPLG
ncbi:MAG: alpha/beta hydrolase [Nocardioidaceae bacterium]